MKKTPENQKVAGRNKNGLRLINCEKIDEEVKKIIDSSGKSTLEFTNEENLITAHQDFYDKVLSENGVLA